jgi:DNA-binding NtrC family response regulator
VVAEANTVVVSPSSNAFVVSLPRFTVRVVAGPDAGQEAQSADGRLSVGTAEGALLRLTDPTVSRYHVDFEATTQGVVVRDLGSTNRTLLSEVAIREIAVTRDVELDVGRSRIRLKFEVERATVSAPLNSEFGSLIGQSTAMKMVFAALERTAATNAPVLITGESGTGKELAARAIHQASSRAAGPFEVVDCGGLPGSLIESELFGREGDASEGEREGAFERAEGGTLFLDELGDLPLALQPKLLRALGEGEIRRMGGARPKQVNVRIVASTNRDLRRHVNSGQFRADLFYRLAVIQIRMPPLRERLEDMALLVRSLLADIAEDRDLEVHIEPDTQLVEALSRHSWPGNVRELRNYLEQLVILRTAPELGADGDPAKAKTAAPGDTTMALAGSAGGAPISVGAEAFEALQRLPLRMAKAELLERFERHYVTQLLQATGGNVAEAARRASVDRVTLFRTIRRYGLKAHNP